MRYLKPLALLCIPRPRRKIAATSLKMTPEVRDLWERCATAEDRSLTNMFEVMVKEHAKRLGISPAVAGTYTAPTRAGTSKTKKKP